MNKSTNKKLPHLILTNESLPCVRTNEKQPRSPFVFSKENGPCGQDFNIAIFDRFPIFKANVVYMFVCTYNVQYCTQYNVHNLEYVCIHSFSVNLSGKNVFYVLA
jgi:hypothetical protein